MQLDSILRAIKKADAAGDTAAAQKLADIANQMMASPAASPAAPEEAIKPDYTYGEMASKSFTRGLKQLGSTFGDVIPAMGASALGFKDYAKRQMEEAKQTQEEISKSYAPQYGKLSDVKGVSDVPGFMLENIVEQVPNIATSLIPGVGGAALAGRTAITAATKTLALQAAERGLAGEAATAFVNQGLKQAAPQLAAKAELGQNVGIFLGSYAQNAPEVFQNVYEKTGELAPGASLLFGAGSAALDSVLPAKLMNKLTGPMKVGIIEKVLEKSGMDKGLLRSVSAGMLEASGAEGLTEGMQEAISIAAENFVGKNPQIFGSKEWERIMESSVRGAVAGGAFGVLGGGIEAGRRGKERQEQYQGALEKRQGRQLSAEVGRMGQQIEGFQAGQAQQELPGFETGPATSLINPPVEETDEVKALREKYEGVKPPKEPKGAQQELFTEQGALTPAVEKAATKDEKAEINKQRLAEQRSAAEVKEAQKKLKAALAELTDTPTDLVSLAQQPSPLAQTIGQVQSENAALAAKRGPKAVQPTTTPTAVTQPNVTPADVTTAVTEPVVVQKPVPLTPQELPTVINDEALKGLGIGPTALIRKNKLLEGKDIATPDGASEVKRILTAYSENRSQPIKEKIDAFLARPEFQGAENVAGNVEQPIGASPAIPSEPNNLPSTGSTGLTEPSGVVSPVAATGETVGGESQQPAALAFEVTKRDASDIFGAGAERVKYTDPASGSTIEVLVKPDGSASVLNLEVPEGSRGKGIGKNLQAKVLNDYPVMQGQVSSKAAATTAYKLGRRPPGQPKATLKNVFDIIDENSSVNMVSPDMQARFETQEGTPSGDQTIETQQTETQGQEAPAKSIGKKAAADKIKAEQGVVAAEQERTKFVEDNDKKADSVMRGILLDTAGKMGVKPQDLAAQSQIGTDEHNMLRLPALLNRYIDLQDIIAKAEEPEQTAKNQRELEGVAKAIAASGGDAPQLLSYLQGIPQKQRDTVISNVTRKAISDFEDRAKGIVEAHIAESKKKLETVEEYTDADAARDADLINEGIFQKLGIRLWSPVYVGPQLDETGRSLAQKGALNSLLGHLGNTIKTPEIQRVLRKIQSLGLKTKIVIGDLQGKAGSYDPATNTITLDPTNGLNAHTVIHEVTHAAISHVLDNPNHPLTREFAKFFGQVKNQFGSAYGANSLQEFAAELTGNPEFQALLKTIKAPRSENMFVRIMQSVAEFLGFRKGQSAYDAGLKFVNNAIDISKDVKPSNVDTLFFGMGPAVSSGFNAVGDIGKSMPQLAGKVLEDARNTFSNISNKDSPMYMGPAATKLLFGGLRLDQLNTLYGKELPSIQKLLDALEMRNGSQEQRIDKINENFKKFNAAQKAHPQAMERLNQLAYDASLEEIDLADPKFKPTPTQAAKAAQMRAAFNSLPADVRNVYTTVRDFYEGSLKEYETFLLQSVSPTLATKLKLQFETRKKLTGYIPFLRRGDFWVEYVDPASGERAASAFQSIREREQFVKDVLKNQPHKLYQNLQQIAFNGAGVPPNSFLGTIMADLQAKQASQQQLDSVYQSYLALFPAQSIAKQFMKRDNVRGMERDIIRAYEDIGIKWAKKLTNSQYSSKIDGALEEIGAQAQNANRNDVYAAADNIRSQSAFFHNPTYSALVHGATSLSYFEFIAGNVSSALVNLTSLPMMVWPMLGGKYGIGNASAAMLNASKVAVNQWQNNPKYKALYQALMDHAQLTHTTAREVLEGRRETTADYTGVKAKILDGLAWPFSVSERYNRATTAIAAYDLAKQNGKSEQEAIREALNMVKDAHTSGLAATAPKWMQHPLGRVAFTFKSFVWNQAFVIARAFHQAYKGESKQIRDAARKQLLATYGMAMAFGGAKGLPFYGAMSTLATMIHSLFGDDDEPYDFNEEMRDIWGEFLYKGAFNYATNLELSNRVGVATDLIYRDDPRSIADHGFALTAIQQALGPAASYAVNSDRAIKMMNEGHVERAFESLAPSFIRNGMKGFRYMTEGAKTLKGDPIEEDIGAYNSLMQAFGFSPANLSSTYEKTSAAKAFEKEVLQRRVRLLNLYDMASTAGDMEMLSEVNDGIASFNVAHPTERITGDTKQKSLTARKNAEKDMINGVTFNKKLRPEIEAKFFEDED